MADSKNHGLALDMDPNIHAAIGAIAVYSGHLDLIITQALGEILGMGQKQARISFGSMDFRPKSELLLAIVNHRASSDRMKAALTSLDEVLSAVSKLQEHRRRLIHGFWQTRGDTLVVSQYYGRNRQNAVEGVHYAVTARGLTPYVQQFRQAVKSMYLWLTEHRDAFAPSPDTPEPPSLPESPSQDQSPGEPYVQPQSSQE